LTTNISVCTSQTVRLRSDTVVDPASIFSLRALLFGEMLQRALPMVRCYYSDLYHDALWLAENLNLADHTSTFAFQWATKEAGTHIGTDLGHVLKGSGPIKGFYDIRIRTEGMWWVAEFVEWDVNYRRKTLAA